MRVFTSLFVAKLLICASVLGDQEHVQHQAHKVHDPIHEAHYKDGEHNDDFDHDAILGSHHAAEEFEKLDPEEAKKRLGLLVDRMDENADSYVSKQELTNWVLASFKHLDQEEAIDKLHEVDENEDGYVTWAEYLHKTYSYSPEDIVKMAADKSEETQTFARMIKEDEEKFALADGDKDKKLDEGEFSAFLHPHDYEHMHQYEIDRTLKDYDKNGDGLIDLGEYLGDRNKRMEFVDQAMVDTENYMEYDRNGDRYLDEEEIARMTVPSQDPAGELEAEHLIQRSDTDGDGQLSRREIIDQHELWVGSSATDYGNLLNKMKRDEL